MSDPYRDIPGLVIARDRGPDGPRWTAWATDQTGLAGARIGVIAPAGTGAAAGGAHPPLRIGAPRPVPVGSRRVVSDSAGRPVGELEHRHHLSLMRSVWAVVGPGDRGVLAWTREAGAGEALGRRLARSLTRRAPVPATVLMVGQRQAARVVPVPGGRGRWGLDLRGVPADVVDRRLVIALLVALDAVG